MPSHTHRYRAKFITGSVSLLASKQEGGHSWLTGLRAASYADAVQELCTLPGGCYAVPPTLGEASFCLSIVPCRMELCTLVSATQCPPTLLLFPARV